MAGSNETTAKFSVDISDLKKGIQEANRQIRLANAEFKAASASMDKWSTSTSGLSAKIEQTDKVLTAQKKILNSYKQEMEQVIAKYGENSKEADNAKIKYENQRAAVIKTQKALGDYKDALVALEKEQAESAKAAEKQATAFESLQKTIDGQENDLSALKSQYANVVLEQGRNSKAAKELGAQISELSGELNDNKTKLSEAEKAADEFDKSLEETTNGGLSVFTVALGNLAANVISGLINSMKEVVGGTIEVGKAFDSSMSNVAALSGASADELAMLRDVAKEYGSTTKFSASQAADALGYMALAGWDAKTSADALGGVLDLAAASGMELAEASDMVTDYMSAFSMEAKDSAYFADILAYAQANANTTAQGLGEAFKNSAANMNAAGQDIETVTSFLAMMANQGLKGSEAGTALTAVMRDMTAKMKDGAIAIGETSVEVMDAEGNYRDLTDIMLDVEAATNGMGDAEKAAALSSTFTADSIKGLNLMLNAGVDEAAKFEEELRKSDGAASDMAKNMNDNLNGDLTNLGSKLEGVQIAIYEKFEPALRDGVKVLDKLLDAVDFVIDHSAEFVAALAAMAAGMATYLGFRTAMKVMEEGWTALTVVTKAQAAAQAILNAVTALSPWMWVVTGIMALVAAFVVLWNKSEAFREFWIGLWEKIKETAGAAWEAVSGFFTDAWDTIKETWGSLSEWFSEKWEGIKEVFSAAGDFIKEIWGSVTDWFSEKWEAIKEIFNAAGEFIKGIWDAAVNYILETFAPLINFFTTTVEIIQQLSYGCWLIIQRVWEIVADWFSKNVIEPVKKFFKDLWDSVKQAASDTWDGIKAAWGAVSEWFITKVVEPIKKFFSDLWDGVKQSASDAWNMVKEVWAGVTSWFDENVITPVHDFFTGMWDGLKQKAADAWEGIKSVFSPVAKWFESTFKKAWQKVKDVFSTGGKIFDGIKEGIIDGFKAVVNAIIRGINKVISIPFNAINNMLDKIRNVEILDFHPFAGLISRFDIPQIPELARGGVLSRGQVGLLEGSGAEAVVPLENNKRWIAAVTRDLKVALKTEGLLAAGAQLAPVVNNNYTFNQTNTSPKALSALEIYRDTNSLIFATQERLS